MIKPDDTPSWLARIKHFLALEPQNQEQLITLLRDAYARALIDSDTLTMIEGILLVSRLQVRDIMLPRKQMTCIQQDQSLEQVIEVVTQSGHSRFPVIGETHDEVIGILHAKDLLQLQTQDEDIDLTEIVRQATFVPESKRLDLLLREFRCNRNHMAIVVDEYGLVSGFITIEDIIEQIVGDIEDEFDIDEEAYIKAHGDTHYIVKAHMPIDEFNEQLKTSFSDADYDTIGGIVMANFGHMPSQGETILLDHLLFKVISADARRIKLLECFDQRPNEFTQEESSAT